ncbi:homeodomain-like protein [Tanacetum coccineum]
MNKLRVNVRKINTNGNKKSLYEEIKSIKTNKINHDKSYPKIHTTSLKDTFEQYLKESCRRQENLNEWMKKLMINTKMNLKDHDSSIKRLEEKANHLAHMISTCNLTNSVKQECAIKLESPSKKSTLKAETFAEKVKRRILKENKEKLLKEFEGGPIHTTLVDTIRDKPEHTQHLQKLVSHEIKIKELSMVKLNARCSAILQNELPPKEKDPGSFILPCTIGSTTVSNALANLGASIIVMPFSLFKRLGLGSPMPINMVIEITNRSMQSPKGIINNVLVKISKFKFPVDFVILDSVEDDKVPIILGRPMLATAHARIDVFGKKISLGVGTKQIIFDINKKESPTIISPVCVINNFPGINESEEPRNLKELLMNDDINGDLGNFLEDNDLFPNSKINNFPARLNEDPTKTLCNPDGNMSIGLEDFDEMDDIWDDLDPGVLTNEVTDSPVKPKFLSSRNRINLYSPYNLQSTCKIGFVNFNPYIEPQSPFNTMSQKVYNSIMKHELVYKGNNMIGFAKKNCMCSSSVTSS